MSTLILVASDGETDHGREKVAEAMREADRLRAAGDSVEIIFQGAGAKSLGLIANPLHRHHKLYASIKSLMTGVCGHCADRLSIRRLLRHLNVIFLDESAGHPNMEKSKAEGRRILVF